MKIPCLVRALSRTLTLSQTQKLKESSRSFSNVAVKKVTKSNFDSTLEDLRSHVRASDFISIDLEMTGITSAPWRECFEFDRPDVLYLKVKDSAEKFAVVQFGICTFRYDSAKESFIAFPHNFYIFPRKEILVDGKSSQFLCQTTSMDFLAKHQFDFNACIHQGISYLSRVQEAEALRNQELLREDGSNYCTGNDLMEGKDIPTASTADVLFVERMKNELKLWIDKIRNPNVRSCSESNEYSPRALETTFFKTHPALVLNGYNSHKLRLIQLVICKHFKDLSYIHVHGEDNSEQKLLVYTDSEEEKALLMKEVREELCRENETKINAATGFRHVIELLASEKKLIVGHNCFLDIVHIHNKFFGFLPHSASEFAASIHKDFPYIIDTKYLLRANHTIQYLMKKRSTSLSSAFTTLCPYIAFGSTVSGGTSFIKIEVHTDEMSSSTNSAAKHAAGYDAFMTGCIFAQICNHLSVDIKSHSLSKTLQHQAIQKYMNRLYLSWSGGAIINLETGNDVPDPNFQLVKRRYSRVLFTNVVVIWRFPPNFKPRELKQCITNAFGSDSLTSVYFIDETAAFIQFSKEEFVGKLLHLKGTLEKKAEMASDLHPLAKLFEGGKTRVVDYCVYKHICSSPLSKFLFADQADAVCFGLDVTTKSEDNESKLETLSPNSSRKPVLDEMNDVMTSTNISCEKILDSLYSSGFMVNERQ